MTHPAESVRPVDSDWGHDDGGVLHQMEFHDPEMVVERKRLTSVAASWYWSRLLASAMNAPESKKTLSVIDLVVVCCQVLRSAHCPYDLEQGRPVWAS